MPITNPKLEQINAASATPVTGAVSPGLHPDALIPFSEPLLGHDGATAAYSAGRAALKNLYESLADMDAAARLTHEKFGGSLVVNGKSIERSIPEERQVELAASLGQRLQSSAAAFDHQYQIVTGVIQELDSRIERAIAPKKDTPQAASAASDIRAYLRGMDEQRRLDFLHKAAVDGDSEIIAAVLSTTPWTSGLDRNQAAMIKEIASEKFALADYKARESTRKIESHLRASAANFAASARKLIPQPKPSAHSVALAKLKESA